jgi:hypothetical protein
LALLERRGFRDSYGSGRGRLPINDSKSLPSNSRKASALIAGCAASFLKPRIAELTARPRQ